MYRGARVLTGHAFSHPIFSSNHFWSGMWTSKRSDIADLLLFRWYPFEKADDPLSQVVKTVEVDRSQFPHNQQPHPWVFFHLFPEIIGPNNQKLRGKETLRCHIITEGFKQRGNSESLSLFLNLGAHEADLFLCRHRQVDRSFDQDVKVGGFLSLVEDRFAFWKRFYFGMRDQGVQLMFFQNIKQFTLFQPACRDHLLSPISESNGLLLSMGPPLGDSLVEILHEVDHLLPVNFLPGHVGLPHLFKHLRSVSPH